MIIPVHQQFEDGCVALKERLRAEGLFAEVDLSRKTMKKSIREAQLEQYNFILVLGSNELEGDTVSVRARGATTEKRGIPTQVFIDDLLARIRNRIPSSR